MLRHGLNSYAGQSLILTRVLLHTGSADSLILYDRADDYNSRDKLAALVWRKQDVRKWVQVAETQPPWWSGMFMSIHAKVKGELSYTTANKMLAHFKLQLRKRTGWRQVHASMNNYN